MFCLWELCCWEVAHTLGAKAVLDNALLPPWQFSEGIPVTRHYDEDVPDLDEAYRDAAKWLTDQWFSWR